MILKNVKRLLQIKPNDYSKDDFLSTIIDLVLAKVRALCNIDYTNYEVLEDEDFCLLIAQIVVDIYLSYVPKSNQQEQEEYNPTPGGPIKSVTIGDYKVEYSTESISTSYTTSSISDSIKFHLDKYDEELVNYRYVRFY